MTLPDNYTECTAKLAGDPPHKFLQQHLEARGTGNCMESQMHLTMRDAVEEDLHRIFEIRIAALKDDFWTRVSHVLSRL